MSAAPLPNNESERLGQLESYGAFGTPPDREYDDLTLIASQICGTPIALISLVGEDKQWLKSRFGLDVAETPREMAFCAHAILQPSELFVVEDATLDDRFKDNALVLGDPHIRFYAGAPLVTPSGDALGTLCVIGRHQGKLTPEQGEALRALARQVMALLEMRRLVAEFEAVLEARKQYEHRLESYQMRLEQMNEELVRQGTKDPLTGAVNRRSFEQRLEEEIGRVVRYSAPCSLVILGIDDFGAFKEAFGHQAGEGALADVGAALLATCREGDSVARLTAEEFAVILPNTEAQGAFVLAERFRRAVASTPWPVRPLTVSVGLDTCEGEGADAGTLTEVAFAAMRKSMSEGGARTSSAPRHKRRAS